MLYPDADKARLDAHRDLILSLLGMLKNAGHRVRSAGLVLGVQRESEFVVEDDRLGIEWRLDSGEPTLDPEWHEAIWYYSHCTLRRERQQRLSTDDFEAMQGELARFHSLSPLFVSVSRLLKIGLLVWQKASEYAGMPWVSVRNSESSEVLELLGQSVGYWCHFHVSHMYDPMRSLILLSFTPALECDKKINPSDSENILSRQHPLFGNINARKGVSDSS